jgi:multidrug efflux pump subunit AcrA (membrane-fusion protein)
MPVLSEAGAQTNYDAAVAGPTREERAIADAQVQAAAAAVTVLERRLDKMVLRAPADGVVSVTAAEVGENVRAGQPILMVEAAGKQWLSFNVREDYLNRLSMGETASVMRGGAAGPTKAVITELRPLGTFATWQADGLLAITTAIRCDCASTRRKSRQAFSRLWLSGSKISEGATSEQSLRLPKCQSTYERQLCAKSGGSQEEIRHRGCFRHSTDLDDGKHDPDLRR